MSVLYCPLSKGIKGTPSAIFCCFSLLFFFFFFFLFPFPFSLFHFSLSRPAYSHPCHQGSTTSSPKLYPQAQANVIRQANSAQSSFEQTSKQNRTPRKHINVHTCSRCPKPFSPRFSLLLPTSKPLSSCLLTRYGHRCAPVPRKHANTQTRKQRRIHARKNQTFGLFVGWLLI